MLYVINAGASAGSEFPDITTYLLENDKILDMDFLYQGFTNLHWRDRYSVERSLPTPDNNSSHLDLVEYHKHLDNCIQQTVDNVRKDYPGEEFQDRFISYLIKEFGFKQLEHIPLQMG